MPVAAAYRGRRGTRPSARLHGPRCSYHGIVIDPGLPGAELVAQGIDDLERGVVTVESLLVSIGAPRLRALGLPIDMPLDDPEHRLWALLAREDPDSAHARYNALVRRLVSFEQALACVA